MIDFRLRIAFSLLAFITIFSFGQSSEQRLEYFLRTVGDKFLLQTGDTNSRVLPIDKVGESYVIRFEDSLSFEPDALIYTIQNAFDKTDRLDSFYVEVEECQNGLVVHSFIAKPNGYRVDIPCKKRGLPKKCYTLYFTPIEGKITDKSPIASEFIFIGLTLLLLGFIGIVFVKRKNNKGQNTIPIGLYLFNKQEMTLILKSQRFELSGKEANLLEYLYLNKNKTLTRDEILNKVWGDEGNYVGRTLDVFISKLRKKLEADQSIKILNIRGVGYRFVVKE